MLSIAVSCLVWRLIGCIFVAGGPVDQAIFARTPAGHEAENH